MKARNVVIALLLLLAACGGGSDDSEPEAEGTTTTTTTTEAAAPEVTPERGLSPAQRRRADQLISTFENSDTELRYDYAENIDDGRGVTAGRAGFTTATCDALAVIEVYSEATEDNGLVRFVPELERLCEAESDDTSRLPEGEYIAAWSEAAADPAFRAAQDAIVDREYFNPAMDAAAELGVELALARAQLYDAAIQHGIGDDADGLPAMIGRTVERVGSPAEAGQEAWLDAFMEVRTATLENPANTESAEAWRESTDRVACFQRIAADGNLDLHGPITFSVYGDEFTID